MIWKRALNAELGMKRIFTIIMFLWNKAYIGLPAGTKLYSEGPMSCAFKQLTIPSNCCHLFLKVWNTIQFLPLFQLHDKTVKALTFANMFDVEK